MPTYSQAVTAVGRLLSPRNGEPQVRDVIARRPDGTFRRLTRQVITPAATTTDDRRR